MLESFEIPLEPPVFPEVQTFSKEWWNNILPPLPPFIPQHFPYNIVSLLPFSSSLSALISRCSRTTHR